MMNKLGTVIASIAGIVGLAGLAWNITSINNPLGTLGQVTFVTQQVSDPCNQYKSPRLEECKELVELYDSTNGDGWTRRTYRKTDKDYCEWFGIRCYNNYVSTIYMVNNNLNGIIPNLNLINLGSINFSFNNLNGNIPNFDKLPNLVVLDLAANQFNGNIPNFDKLPNLNHINFNNNLLEGNVPNFDKLPNLKTLSLYYNNLNGNIPNFDKLPNLESLDISHNKLEGNIPNFDKLPKIKDLRFYYNILNGNIPNFDKLPNLQILYLDHNQLNGAIPNFDKLPALQYLYLDHNQLCGKPPTYWINKSFIKYIDHNNIVHDEKKYQGSQEEKNLYTRAVGANIGFKDQNTPSNCTNLSSGTKYSCSTTSGCYIDPNGKYDTLLSCKANCVRDYNSFETIERCGALYKTHFYDSEGNCSQLTPTQESILCKDGSKPTDGPLRNGRRTQVRAWSCNGQKGTIGKDVGYNFACYAQCSWCGDNSCDDKRETTTSCPQDCTGGVGGVIGGNGGSQ